MADEFLETYAAHDFTVLVQAEVASISQKRVAAEKAAEKFASAAQVVPKLAAGVPAPWRRTEAGSKPPPLPVGNPVQRDQPKASQLPSPVPAAASSVPPSEEAMQALRSLQAIAENMAKPIAPAPAAPASSAATAPPKGMPAAAPTGIAMPPQKRLPDPAGEDEMTYLRRRLHNSQRAGRNRLYYQVLNLHGPAAAAKYWQGPEGASSSSQGSKGKGKGKDKAN